MRLQNSGKMLYIYEAMYRYIKQFPICVQEFVLGHLTHLRMFKVHLSDKHVPFYLDFSQICIAPELAQSEVTF